MGVCSFLQGYIGIYGVRWGYVGSHRDNLTSIMGNQMEKNREHEMETGIVYWFIGIRVYGKEGSLVESP